MSSTLPAITKSVNRNGAVEYHVEAAAAWDGFDSLVQYLTKHWQAQVAESVDGPYSRRWVLRAHGVPISLYHDSHTGNFFVREDGNADQSLLEQIADDLARRLA